MGIEVRFKNDIDIVNKSDAPHNSKFGDPQNLQEAIQAARGAHQDAGGDVLAVDGEDVVIVARGDNLWKIWEKYAKPQGITWEEFLASNKHLQQPTNLGGSEQSGWKPYHLVHEGDVVFIPDRSVSVSNGTNAGPVVKQDGKWKLTMVDEKGRTTYHEINKGDTLTTHDGVRYNIAEINHDTNMVVLEPLKPDGQPDPSKKITMNLSEFAE